MATAVTLIVPLEEYLSTSYRPDRDWIDGELKERNMGEQPHARVQVFLGHILFLHRSAWKIVPLTEQRVQTSASHFRIADLCVVRRDLPMEPIVCTPPVLCVEILSRDDRMSEMSERLEDYLTMGVQAVWVIDPLRRRAYLAQPQGAAWIMKQVTTHLRVPETPIEVPLVDLFAELDELDSQP